MKALLLVIAAGALSGLLLALALPPSHAGWLGPVCLAPLFAAVSGKGLMRGFIGGITVPAVACWLIQTNLLYNIPSEEGSPKWILLGCGFFGFLIAILSCVAAEVMLDGWRRILLLPSLAVLLELALFPILPAHLALTQYRAGGVMILASIGGIWLVSLLLWMANAAFGEVLRRVSYGPAAILTGVLLFAYALVFLPRGDVGVRTRVAAVQTLATDIKALRRMNGEAARRGAVLAVWPEFSGLEMATSGDTSELRDLSKEEGQTAFVTSFRDSYKPLPHNTAALFAGGKESLWYFKQKLFGGEINMHAPGSEAVAVPWFAEQQLGLNICYDSCYPAMVRQTASLKDVGLIALPTIDPESTNCFVAAVHSAFTPFRAAESGVPVVRADGGAFSQVVDGTGRIVAEIDSHREEVLVADVSLGRRWTLYSLLGDWVLYLAGAYVLYEIGRKFRRQVPPASSR